MLAYTARRPAAATRGSSPNAMLAIITVHVAALAVLMSAKMDLPRRIIQGPLIVDLIHQADPPPPVEANPRTTMKPTSGPSHWTRVPPTVPTPASQLPGVEASPPFPDLGRLIGPDPIPAADPLPRPALPSAAQLLTPPAELKPPYPQSKLLSEEQAVLRLRLTIDERGRVVAVAPVERADPAFLDAARRHILAHWRYRPAATSGRAIVSSVVITLHFELDG